MKQAKTRAGQFRHYVTIERKTPTRDADGGERVVWATLSICHASIEPLPAREFFASQQAQSEVTAKIRFRYPRDIAAADRVSYLGKFYAVHSVAETDIAHREIIAMVAEGVTDGR